MTQNVAINHNNNNNNDGNINGNPTTLLSSSSIQQLITAESTDVEIEQLQYVMRHLSTHAQKGSTLMLSFQSPQALQSFVSYALNRRFGWSENKTNTLIEHKQSLNNLLDSFIHILCNQPFTPLLCDLLLSSASCSNANTVSHVVRDQTYKLLFDWIKCQHHMNDVIIIQFDKEFENEYSDMDREMVLETHDFNSLDVVHDNPKAVAVDMPSVIRVIVSGLTDVWSAIRNSCASRTLSLLETFDPVSLENLFVHLSAICTDSSALWQTKEGAALGIVSILKAFRLEPIKIFAPDQSQPSVLLQLGRNRYEGLPVWLHNNTRGILFPLLSHPQLSIREIAKKGLVAFHARSPRSDILITRDQLVRSLLALPSSSGPLPEPSMLPSTHPITDPYAAEGLLSVCNTIMRADAHGLFSYEDWRHQLHAYILYLAHPASTVRIEASAIFKHIVARYTDSSFVVRMVLQCLGAGWHFPFHSPLLPPNVESLPYLPLSGSSMQPTQTIPTSPSWEWKEGRLLAYELLFRFLLANHVHYTQPHSHRLRRVSKTKLSYSTPTTPNSSAPNTPSTPNRPVNPYREGMARSISLERVDSIPATSPTPQPRASYPNIRNSGTIYPNQEGTLRLSSHALSLIEQLADGGTTMPTNLPFVPPLPISTILQHISAQVSESFGFPRWEINRMAEQVLKPLVDTLYLLGTSVNATLSTPLVPPVSPASSTSPSVPLLAEQAQENSLCSFPMLNLLWYHAFASENGNDNTPKPDLPQRQAQKLRPHFLSHARRDSHSHSSDKGQHRVRSYSNPHLRLIIPTSPISSSTQFMACKSLRHALVLVSSRSYAVRNRDEISATLSTSLAHRPHSPQNSASQTTSQSTYRPSSPNIDRRHSLQPLISQHVIGNLEHVQTQVVNMIVGLLEPNSNLAAVNDDRLIVAACELLVIISVGDWLPISGVNSNAQVVGQVFQWMARLTQSRKSKIEGQLLSALHPHLIKLMQRIPVTNKPNPTGSTTKSDAALTLACYLVPLIPSHADPVLQSSLLDAVASALDKLLLETVESFFDMDNLRLLCTLCTKWLVRLVTKPLEGSVLRSALGVLHRVVRVVLAYKVSVDAILAHIFKAIALRLSPFIPHSPASGLPSLDTLSLQSNEIKRSWDGGDMDSDFDEAENDEDDEDDDWDDEDDTTGGEVVLGECVTFLHDIKTAEPVAISKMLLTLSASDRSILCWAISKNEML